MEQIIEMAVVDDFPPHCAHLAAELEAYASQRALPWHTAQFSSGEALLSALAPGRFAAVFLDILMDGLDGLETAQRIMAQDPGILIIFVTTEAGYALEGYELSAFGFLVKGETDSRARFERLMARLEKRLSQDNWLTLSKDGTVLRTAALLYAEVQDHNMAFHLQGGTTLTRRMAMEELMALLPQDGRFFECYRGIVVNLDAVADIRTRELIMTNGDHLPVSRRRQAALEQAFANRCFARTRLQF